MGRPLTDRELVVECAGALAVVAASVAAAAWLPAERPLALGTGVLVVLLYAIVSRITIEIGAGFAVPTQLVLVPMLFAVPASVVPLLVAMALLLGATPGLLRRSVRPERGIVAVGDAWHAVGPALVFTLGGVGDPSWADWPLYLAALGAQCAADLAASTARERLGRGIAVGVQLRVLGSVYLVDALLSPPALLVAFAASARPWAVLAVLPLAALLAIVVEDRSARLHQALEASRKHRAAAAELRASIGQIREGEERFRLLVESVEDYAIFMLDPEGRVASWNLGAERVTGYRADEVMGEPVAIFYPRLDVARGTPGLALSTAETEGRWTEEAPRLRKDGSLFLGEDVTTALRDEGGRLRGYARVTHDVTVRRGLEAVLAHQALHDALTGLPNRVLFLEELRLALTRQRQPGMTAVLFVDLDRFKLVNDSFGHLAGDDLLVDVARRLLHAVRRGDTVGRLGGDEFTVLCEDIQEPDAIAVADRISQALERPFRFGDQDVFVDASIGIAFARDNQIDPEEVLRHADVAMYRAKGTHAARYEVFDEGMRSRSTGRLRIESALRRAIERDELRLAYQPQVDLETGRLAGLEALVRWHRGSGPLVGPAEFIPMAEETGLILPIGAWVLLDACRQAARWKESRPGERPLGVSVNLSAAQIADRSFVRTVEDALAATGADPADICLEITESMIMSDLTATVELLGALSELGVRLAIDDFGTGYASLTTLQRFPVSVLKIDGSFIQGLGRSASGSALVSAVTGMGHALALSVVSEWVETAEQVAELRTFGCDFAQGFYFSPPQSVEALDVLLAADPSWSVEPVGGG